MQGTAEGKQLGASGPISQHEGDPGPQNKSLAT